MRIQLFTSLLLVGIAIVLAGCPATDGDSVGTSSAGDGTQSESVSQLEGEVTIDGSSTVFPITEAVADAFRQKFPKVNVTVGVSGTGGGFKRFTKGETDISNASRPIKAEEFEQCKASKTAFLELPVAYDGLSVVVNPSNDWATELTVDDLKKIFLESPNQPTNWKDVKADYPDVPLKIYAPGTASGTFDYFKEVVASDEGDAIRSDMSVSEDDNVLVTGVAGEKGAIGFFGCAYLFENADKIKAVPIVNKAGEATMPAPDTIESGAYNPLSRPLFIYVNTNSFRRPEMKRFVEFYLANAPKLSADVGYVALPEAVYQQATDNVNNRLAGTHYTTAEGTKREGPVTDVFKPENVVNFE
jgi:phosphate transport system substrate-binding protein